MTSVAPPPDAVPDVTTLERTAGRSLLRRVLREPVGLLTTAYLLLLVAVGVLGDELAPHPADQVFTEAIQQGPSGAHLLGTDVAGQDILSRLILAVPGTLQATAVALMVSAVVGVTAGLLSGYYGRWVGGVSSWTSNLVMALPSIVVLLAARAALGPNINLLMIVFGVLIAPAFYRVVEGTVSAVRHELYVDAARVSGLSDSRIIARHILTVVRAPAIILGANIAGIIIAVQAGLDFLGLGDLSKPTWGSMLAQSQGALLSGDPLPLLWPALAIGATCMAFTLLGSTLRDVLERSGGIAGGRGRNRHAEVPAPERGIVLTHDEPVGRQGDVLLAVEGLAIGYDAGDAVTHVVQDASFTIRKGEVHGLIGESGSGKTQTAFAVLGLLPVGGRVVAGSICFDGVEFVGQSERERAKLRGARIAYVPQEPMSNLDPSATIGAQLAEPLRAVLGLSRTEAKQRALQLLARVGIPDPIRAYAAYPHQVSGGMAQRVLIAGAVSCEPDLLIADEPTTALDVTVQAEVLDMLRDLHAEFEMAVLLVTHNFGVVADVCDRVSVMREGRVIETGTTHSLFAAPQHEYTRSLFAAILEDAPARGPFVARAGVQEAQS